MATSIKHVSEKSTHASKPALSILKERYVRGELTREQYLQMRKDLESDSGAPGVYRGADPELLAAVYSHMSEHRQHETSRILAGLIRALHLDSSSFQFECLQRLDPVSRAFAEALIKARLANAFPVDSWENAYHLTREFENFPGSHDEAPPTRPAVEKHGKEAPGNGTETKPRVSPSLEELLSETEALLKAARAEENASPETREESAPSPVPAAQETAVRPVAPEPESASRRVTPAPKRKLGYVLAAFLTVAIVALVVLMAPNWQSSESRPTQAHTPPAVEQVQAPIPAAAPPSPPPEVAHQPAGALGRAPAPETKIAASPEKSEIEHKPATAPAAKSEIENQAAAKSAGQKSPDEKPGERQYFVQLGTFANPANARQLQQRASAEGFRAYTEVVNSPEGKTTRVRAGPFPTREEAQRARAKLKEPIAEKEQAKEAARVAAKSAASVDTAKRKDPEFALDWESDPESGALTMADRVATPAPAASGDKPDRMALAPKPAGAAPEPPQQAAGAIPAPEPRQPAAKPADQEGLAAPERPQALTTSSEVAETAKQPTVVALKPESLPKPPPPRGTLRKDPGEDWLGGHEDLNLGIEQFEAGQYRDAAVNLQKALASGLSIKRDRVKAQKYVALAHCAEGRETQCREAFQRLLKLDPGHELDAKEASIRSAGPIFHSVKNDTGDSR
jgi:DedD protein